MRCHIPALVLVVAAAFVLGCSMRDEPAETLDLCGNHSCGDLVMVTNDTSSSGYQYLEPAISPDQTRLAFTADWEVIPASVEPEPLQRRQIMVMPMPADPWSDDFRLREPVTDVQALGVQLVFAQMFVSWLGGSPLFITNAHQIDKGNPIWVDDSTLLFIARFSGRDRMLLANVEDPGAAPIKVLYYEPDDLVVTGGLIYYHNDPALSPDGRWLLFTRFGCDGPPNASEPGFFDEVHCSDESLWVLDMQTIITEDIDTADDLLGVAAFPLTSGASNIEDPAWSPDGRSICFAATTDLVGQYGGTMTELFSIAFDAAAAEAAVAVFDHENLGEELVPLDQNLRRLTTTSTNVGDPIVGLHNYGPTYSATGGEIYFTSSRRAPATTLRTRSIWRIPADGRLEPEILFFSRRDDVHPTVFPETGWLLFSSRLGFPTYLLNWVEAEYIDYLTNVYNPGHPDHQLSEIEILRRAEERRNELEFFEDVMSHLYLYRLF